MASPCKVCNHDQRTEIERLLVGGMSNVAASEKWGMGRDAVRRHRVNHMSRNFGTLTETAVKRETATALERAENLFHRADTILRVAEESGNANLAINAMKETRQAIELLAKLSGELDTSTNINVLNLSTSEEWMQTRGVMLEALAPYPDARMAVAKAVQQVES